MLTAHLITDEDGLARFRDEWDRLAVAAGRPYCAPAWLMAWWRFVAPAAAVLSVVAVCDGDELVGLAPYFLEARPGGLSIYRLLGCGSTTRIGPIARAGAEARVAEAVAATLADAEPGPSMITFEGVEEESPWPALLSHAWPGRRGAWMHRDNALPSSLVDRGDATYEDWLAAKPRRLVKELRRTRRRLEELGGTIRCATGSDAARQLEHVCRLHHARWDDRGGSANLGPGVEDMLHAAIAELGPSERARVWLVELDGQPISAELMFVAGEEMAAWGGGFDPEWSRLAPGVMALTAAVEDSFGRGERRFDLGEGGESYKRRLADREGRVVWDTMFPRTRRYPLTRARMLPRHVEYWARRQAQGRLSPAARRRIRRALPVGR